MVASSVKVIATVVLLTTLIPGFAFNSLSHRSRSVSRISSTFSTFSTPHLISGRLDAVYRPSRFTPSALSAIDPSSLDHSMLDPSVLHTVAGSLLHSSSALVGDASAAAADAAADAATKDGWWEGWLSIFRGSLVYVHDDIVDPVFR